MRYVSRRVEVEAFEWRGSFSDLPAEWRALELFEVTDDGLVVRTNRGPALARVGDYIVRGTVGEFYPIDAPIFEHKYEAFTDA